jgi:hypothetical protein
MIDGSLPMSIGHGRIPSDYWRPHHLEVGGSSGRHPSGPAKAAIRKRQSVGSWLHGVAIRLARKAKAAAVPAIQYDPQNRSRAAVDRLPSILHYLVGLTRGKSAVQGIC